MKTRIVEVYVGTGGPDSGSWFVTDVEVNNDGSSFFAEIEARNLVRSRYPDATFVSVKGIVNELRQI